MSDSTTPQDGKAMPPASAGSHGDLLPVLRSLADGVRGMGLGDPDCGDRIEASDVVRWAVDEIERLRLTDEERDVLGRVADDAGYRALEWTERVVRGLLERLK